MTSTKEGNVVREPRDLYAARHVKHTTLVSQRMRQLQMAIVPALRVYYSLCIAETRRIVYGPLGNCEPTNLKQLRIDSQMTGACCHIHIRNTPQDRIIMLVNMVEVSLTNL